MHEHEPIDMTKCVLFWNICLYNLFSFTFKTYHGLNFSQSNGNGKTLLYSCKSNEMHYLKKMVMVNNNQMHEVMVM